jgi:hypothetical protein
MYYTKKKKLIKLLFQEKTMIGATLKKRSLFFDHAKFTRPKQWTPYHNNNYRFYFIFSQAEKWFFFFSKSSQDQKWTP